MPKSLDLDWDTETIRRQEPITVSEKGANLTATLEDRHDRDVIHRAVTNALRSVQFGNKKF